MFQDYFLEFISYSLTAVLLFLELRRWSKGEWCRCPNSLHGKTAIVTGANSGIGKEIAKDLARRGAKIILACRNMKTAQLALEEITHVAQGELKVLHIDLSSLKSVRSFAETVLREEPRIDILINNAALVTRPQITEDGYDIQWQTNYLGPFLLIKLLLDRLKQSGPSRIINVSSCAHLFSRIQWHDLSMKRSYFLRDMFLFGQTKLAQVMFTKELSRRLADTNVVTYAVDPGLANTPILNSSTDFLSSVVIQTISALKLLIARSATEAAQTIVYCAVADELRTQNGIYYRDCKHSMVNPLIKNDEMCRKLWRISEAQCD